jgi:hypothetical protein
MPTELKYFICISIYIYILCVYIPHITIKTRNPLLPQYEVEVTAAFGKNTNRSTKTKYILLFAVNDTSMCDISFSYN